MLVNDSINKVYRLNKKGFYLISNVPFQIVTLPKGKRILTR